VENVGVNVGKTLRKSMRNCVYRDGIVAGIFLFEPPADLRIGRIEAVDDLGDDFPLGRTEDPRRAVGMRPLDRPADRPAARGR
jgi:hypothetical protein